MWIVKGTANTVLNCEVGTVTEGELLIVPRGTMHIIINTDSRCSLKQFTVYTPLNYPDGTVHKTKADAEAAHHD